MSYRNENLLKKIVDIQNITLEQKKYGATQKWIFENLIAPRYYISRTTYYNYLSSEAKKLLRESVEKKKSDEEAKAGEINEKQDLCRK